MGPFSAPIRGRGWVPFGRRLPHASEQDRPDVAAKRTEWKGGQDKIDPGRLIFIDETWAKTNMTRLRGRAPRGQRLIAKTPHGHWMTTTLIAALSIDGIRCSTVVDGAINGDVFEAFVRHVLLPELRPGDIVVMDNLSSHKRLAIRQLIESVGTRLVYLPPYSRRRAKMDLVGRLPIISVKPAVVVADGRQYGDNSDSLR